jgi:hypothetical protein
MKYVNKEESQTQQPNNTFNIDENHIPSIVSTKTNQHNSDLGEDMEGIAKRTIMLSSVDTKSFRTFSSSDY